MTFQKLKDITKLLNDAVSELKKSYGVHARHDTTRRTSGNAVVLERVEVEVEDLRLLHVDRRVLQVEATVLADVMHNQRSTATYHQHEHRTHHYHLHCTTLEEYIE